MRNTEENPLKQDTMPISTVKGVDFKKVVLSYEETLKKAAKAKEATKGVQDVSVVWEDNADSLDSNLRAKSENAYIRIAQEIVESAQTQLLYQNRSKNSLKKIFTVFFVAFLSTQYVVLAVLLLIRTFQSSSMLSDAVIITYISSVFVETLGAVILMIRYAFDSKQETQVLDILNSIITRFQKVPK